MRQVIEFLTIVRILWAARRLQDFLWQEQSASSFEGWMATLQKRIDKMHQINPDNPHREVELRKRLLQIAAISIRMLTAMREYDVFTYNKRTDK